MSLGGISLSTINTSYQKLPFGSGDDSDKLFFFSPSTKFQTHQTENYPVTCFSTILKFMLSIT